jgi:hypothetical protein
MVLEHHNGCSTPLSTKDLAMKSYIFAALAAAPLVGCASTTSPDGEPEEAVPTETVVRFDEGGAPNATVRPLRVEQTSRSACADADLQLWDSPYYTGSTICFIGSGHADLTTYRYTYPCGSRYCWSPPGLNWAGRVRSYRMAPYPTHIKLLAEPYASVFTDGACGECVRAGSQRSTAGACAQRATAIDVISLPAYETYTPPSCRH